jgi:glycosyltransferase involved in cell wall biosynthesis
MEDHRARRGSPRQIVFLGAGSEMQCGVGHFTQRLADVMERRTPGDCTELTLTRTEGTVSGLWQVVGDARAVVCNFPIVAWKRVIVRPLLALAMARLRRRRVIVIQHEWSSLNWMRRITYIPALLLADSIVMFSPLIKRQLAESPIMGWLVRRCVVVPLPPNIAAPRQIADSPLRQRLASARRDGRFVIGHFGSIYPGKQPEAVLEIGALLKPRGRRPLLVFIGSFIRGVDRAEEAFYERVVQLGLASDVIVSGFVASEQELFGLFEIVQAFCYHLEEGLTARRASIVACTQSGKPVVVTAAEDADEFAHHPRFQELIARGSIVLVPRGAGNDAYADALEAAVDRPAEPPSFDFEGWWSDTAIAIDAEL